MTTTTQTLLDTLATYPATEDAASKTLPPAAYTDPGLYELEVETIFKHEWLLIGRANDIPEPGDWFTFQVIDDPLLVVRGADHEIRAFSNVCRHRYMPVAQGTRGNDRRFVCPYHHWTYATDGKLIAAPLMEGSLAFDKSKCALPMYRLEIWQGFIFVNLDDNAAPLTPQLFEADKMLAHYSNSELVTGFSYDTVWEGNWKLATENGMEFYHHMGLHAATLEEALPAKGASVDPAPASGRFAHTRCPFSSKSSYKDGEMARALPEDHQFTELEINTAYAIGLFPNISLAMTADSNNWLSFIPLGPERTRVVGGYIVRPGYDSTNPEAAQRRNQLLYDVNEEDAQATWRLQKVLRSTRARPGPLNVREGTCAQFYKYLGRTLAPRPAADANAASPGVEANESQ
jgi:choline monooxygenase